MSQIKQAQQYAKTITSSTKADLQKKQFAYIYLFELQQLKETLEAQSSQSQSILSKEDITHFKESLTTLDQDDPDKKNTLIAINKAELYLQFAEANQQKSIPSLAITPCGTTLKSCMPTEGECMCPHAHALLHFDRAVQMCEKKEKIFGKLTVEEHKTRNHALLSCAEILAGMCPTFNHEQYEEQARKLLGLLSIHMDAQLKERYTLVNNILAGIHKSAFKQKQTTSDTAPKAQEKLLSDILLTLNFE